MKFQLTALMVFAFVTCAISQPAAADQLETSNGPVTIQPILHGSLVLSWNGITIYIDPYGGAKAFNGIEAPDLILITDIHGDHMNEETLRAVMTSDAFIVAPQAVSDKLPEDLRAKILMVMNNDTEKEEAEDLSFADIHISTVPMYNLPEASDSRHTKGRGNGYILEFGEKSIYISGDTEDIPEMRALKDIDVAFVCMNLPYTMDINQAASAVLEFKPKVIYPYHYRGQEGLSDVAGFKKLIEAGDPKKSIEVRLRNWYPEY
jgi:L-ascorbate metabolism protein UlaG (beta-lactamase superfamily)